ncbi:MULTISPECIES: hypothetical protein [Gulbenkiania]|uniref:Prokaryotic membrane lipoprotein lipid attachment site n=2 Tax=Gulbenkiania TaxID=397456 RepID=A0A0K6GUH3_9NEIS|nr:MULTISPECIES: hypothetical protein [Gulbenkiania]TCW33786.1 hypothetical protein EV669_101318 [Gulbenkiania mobilis]CUA82157.1 hypothetical protein Ga0061063_1017 [Gulbenkiania indica]
MKALIPIAAAALFLSGCAALDTAPPAPARPQRPVPVTPSVPKQSNADRLLQEAGRLADRIKSGQISRAGAADELNRLRLRLVGANAVDDNTFALYRQIAVQRDRGVIGADEAQSRMEARLRDWLRRWPKYTPKPADPAFTQFLLKLYRLPPLGY